MELKFIWVKDYKILKNIGINFNHSGKFSFSYDDERLNLHPNKEQLLDFGKHISGITAIAGKNGSGKSSICEVVLLSTATLTNGMFGYDRNFDGIVCYGNHIFYQSKMIITNKDELIKSGFSLESFENSPLESNGEWRDSFLKGGFIYYSNAVDINGGISGVNLANISTQNYLYKEAGFSTGYPVVIRSQVTDGNRDRKSQMELFNLGEGYRAARLFVNFPDIIPFSLPEYILLKSTYTGNNRFLNIDEFEYEDTEPYRAFEKRIFEKICPEYWSFQSKEEITVKNEDLKAARHELYKLNLLIALSVRDKKLFNKSIAEEFIFKRSFEIPLGDIPYRILALASLHLTLMAKSEKDDFTFNPASERRYYEYLRDWRFPYMESSWVPVTPENTRLLRRFMDIEDSVLRADDWTYRRISNYGIAPYLSAGQYSFVSLFARIFETLTRYKRDHDNRESLILFIDEGEVGFHPAWKKNYLKWLLDFLNNRMGDFQFQIILTTHSPYLLSDLPPQNVLLLKRNKEGNTEIIPSDEISTFGGNIHEILADSFFLEDGFIGEFAKGKIQAVIDLLNQWRTEKNQTPNAFVLNSRAIDTEKKRVIDIISIISDEIVRNKLFEMYWDLFKDRAAVDREIEILEERLNSLKERNR